MVNNQQNELIVQLYETRKQKSDAEKLEKAILEALKPLVNPKFDKLPDQPIVSGEVELKRSSGSRPSISSELLLERGVAPDIIRYATKVSTYFSYLTTKPKKKE